LIGQLGVKKLLKIMPEGGALQARLDKLVEVYFKPRWNRKWKKSK